MVSGGYYLGYALQVPAGILVGKFDGHLLCTFGMLVSLTLSIVISFLFDNWKLMLVCRVVQGVGATVALPSMVALYTRWSPRFNRTCMFCWGMAGFILGILLAEFTKDSISDADDMVTVCQIYGATGVLWLIIWTIFITGDPDSNRWTSLTEKEYIRFNRLPGRSSPGAWVWLITSAKSWAIYVTHICLCVSCSTLYIGYRNFYRSHHIDPSTAGDPIYLAPFIGMLLSCLITGRIADLVISWYPCQITTIRKMLTCVGMVIPGILSITVATLSLGNSETTIIYGYMAIATVQGVLMGLVFGGSMVGYMDLTVNLAPVMISIGSTLATLSTLAIPFLLRGYVIKLLTSSSSVVINVLLVVVW